MSKRANYFGLWERLAAQRSFNPHLHYDLDPRDIAYVCNAMEDFTALEVRLALGERVVEAARRLEPHSATLEMARRWAAFEDALAEYDAQVKP